MNPKDREDFLKRPRLDIGGRHKKKRIEIAGRWATAQDRDAVESLMTVARDQQDNVEVRLAAVQALGTVGDGQTVPTLATLLNDQAESELHRAAITALADIGDDHAVRALIGAWEQQEAAQQAVIQQTLIAFEPERTVEPLIEALGHASPAVREQAATTLRQFEGIASRLVVALGHEDTGVRDGVQALLVQTGTSVVPDLVTALGQADDGVREGAIQTLAQVGEPAVPSLLASLTGDDGRQAQAVDEILAEMGEQAIQSLVARLDDAELGKRAAERLAQIGEPALPVLFQRLCDPDCTDQDSVIETMCAIAGTDRLTLAQKQYYERIPFLLPHGKQERTTMMFRELTFQEIMSWEDGAEELKSQDVLGRVWAWPPDYQAPEPAEAISQLQAIVAIAPKFAPPHYWIGQWYLVKLRDVEKAIQAFEQATHCQEHLYADRQAKSYWWLGVSYGTPSPYFDYAKSQSCFERTLELGWDASLVYQAIQMSAQALIDQCVERGQNPDLFLSAMRTKTEALGAFVEREPDREDASELWEDSRDILDRTERDYARLGEVAAFAKIRGQLLVSSAYELSQNDHDQQAIDLLHALLQEQPDNEPANIALANILVGSGQVCEGIKRLAQSLPEEHGTEFYILRANLFNLIGTYLPLIDQTLDRMILQGRFSEALMLLNDLQVLFLPTTEIRDMPVGLLERLANVLNKIGYRYSQVAEASDILVAYERSVECIETAFSYFRAPYIVRNVPLVHRDIAEYLALHGQWGQAIEHLQRAVEVDPQFGDGWWRLSVAYIQLQDMESSMTCLLQAAALGDADALDAMARLTGL